MNAHRINEGKKIRMDNSSRDFFFLERKDVPVIYKHIVQLLRDKLPGYVKCRQEDIQVLTPMRKGMLGVEQLNVILQETLNPPDPAKKEYRRGDTVFREGDKVMQIRNNYQIAWQVRGNFGIPVDQGQGVFNGDFGTVADVNAAAQLLTVLFDENRTVEYPFAETDQLELSYAVTVHKSQGAEYPAVILPLLSGPPALFSRNLLYTAVTRAKNCVVILGSRQTVENMISNPGQNSRNTGLKRRIQEMGKTDD
jgi:exodeoxyribonuclease V alpha subunit